MNSFLIISSSLNPESKSRIMAKEVFQYLEGKKYTVSFLDLEQMPLAMCDAGAAYRDATTQEVAQMINKAQGILVASPIYNYNTNAALKNLIELTGESWENKVVSFMVAAGGHSSYMGIMPTANSLMLDFRSIIVPRFVYATKEAFDGETIHNEDITKRLHQLADETVRLTSLLFPSS